MNCIYKDFCEEKFDGNGMLCDFKTKFPDNFNYSFDVIDRLAEKCPDKTALIHVGKDHSERRYTFSQIKEMSCRASNFFRSVGIGKGDIVMLVLKRNVEFWFSILGLHRIGAVVLPATNQLQKKDYVYRFNAAGVRAIIATSDDDVCDHIDAAQHESPTLEIKIIGTKSRDGWISMDKGLAEASPVFERPSDPALTNKAQDIMLMFFSSGTTGYPKIVAHSFTYPLGHIVTARHWHNVDPNGMHLTIADTGWGKALWGKLYGQWLAETCVFVYDFDRFHADDVLSVISKYKITTFCAPPTMYRFFINEDLSKYDLSSLKYCTIAGEALNPEVFRKFYDATGIKVMEGFGQTETTLVVANLVGMNPKPGSMGKPTYQYDVDLFGADGNPVGLGESGEIVIKADYDDPASHPAGLFLGYYKDEEKTREAWYDGYYHTGDTAWRDEDGYFWYVGRNDDLIKSSGYRIGPFEIESVLMEHPSVLECAVTAVPDPIRGQAVKATIVLKNGFCGTPELVKEIQSFVKQLTAPYKYPRVVEFVSELPKTISGKIKRNDLRGDKKQPSV